MQNHHHKTCQNNNARKPAKRIRPLSLARVHRLAIGIDLPKYKSSRKASQMRGIVDAEAAPKSDEEQDDDRIDQLGPQLAHERPSALGGDCEHGSDQPQQRAARAEGKVPRQGAYKESKRPRNDVQKKISRRSVELFQRRTKLHESHHVESDVNQ